MRIVILAAAFCLSACTTSPTLRTVTDDYVDTRRALHSDLTDASLGWLCNGVSVYEYRQRFNTAARARAWEDLCLTDTPMPHAP